MFSSLPKDATGILEWSWEDFQLYYQDLIGRTVAASNVDDFLTEWSKLSELVEETASRLHVAFTCNTEDKRSEELYQRFLDTIYPEGEKAEQQLKQKLVAVGGVPDGFELPFRKMETELEIFREENLALHTEAHKLGMEYDKVIGSQTVEWDGKEVTIAQLRPVYQDIDRPKREKAWRLATGRMLEDRDRIDELWKKLLNLRLQMASNAGFQDYRAFRWKEFCRFDYTPEDCKRFHDAIEKAVVPVAARVCEKRRARLGTDSLRPWDFDVDPEGRPPLKPFTDVTDLKEGVQSIVGRVDSSLRSYFDIMMQEKLLDLDNRKHKAPGGYCTTFAAAKRPFIFMNAVGIHDDVQTLLHESGHCFHAFESAALPYYQQRDVGMEFAEVASMTMELLGSPFFARSDGGFYDEEGARRAVTDHLEQCIMFWPYMSVVDLFQHWIYENPVDAADPEKCDARWAAIQQRFLPWIDWTGLDEELKTGWHRKLHIFHVPFYYVEYGLAQLGAGQIWRRSLEDRPAATEAYRSALALGGTVSIPKLFEAAGAKFAFDAGTLTAVVKLMEDKA